MTKPTKIELHAGHAWKVKGAVGHIDEFTENRRVAKRVYEILTAAKVPATYYEDTQSTTQRQNINNLVAHHNADRNGLIVSIHFNAGGDGTKAIGTEVLYYDQKELAEKLSKAISDSTGGGLKNRGTKQRKDLGVLASTYEPAVLIEVCFVNSIIDVAIYRRDFEKICQAIAKELAAYIGYKINNKSEGLTVDQYNELKKLIEAQMKTIELLEEQLKVSAKLQTDGEVHSSHKEAWDWAITEGIIKGNGKTLNPNGALTRQQMATMLKRYHDKHIANK